MVEAGLEWEIRELLKDGIPASSPALKSLGYKEWLDVVRGLRSTEDAMDLFVRNTRQYARRQMTWFRNRYRGALQIRCGPDETAENVAQRISPHLHEGWGLPQKR
jgi:tRNA dimethylallyltransferase